MLAEYWRGNWHVRYKSTLAIKPSLKEVEQDILKYEFNK